MICLCRAAFNLINQLFEKSPFCAQQFHTTRSLNHKHSHNHFPWWKPWTTQNTACPLREIAHAGYTYNIPINVNSIRPKAFSHFWWANIVNKWNSIPVTNKHTNNLPRTSNPELSLFKKKESAWTRIPGCIHMPRMASKYNSTFQIWYNVPT